MKYFAESELIINEDGSIFHLHLLPEQLAQKIILVGDPGRVSLVASHFDTIECDVQSREKKIRQKLVQKRLTAKYSFATIIYKSRVMSDCIAIAQKICNYDSAVLIEGESGVGKELFAQSIHNGSKRRLAPPRLSLRTPVPRAAGAACVRASRAPDGIRAAASL